MSSTVHLVEHYVFWGRKPPLLLIMSKTQTVHSGVQNVLADDGGNF